MSYDLVLLLHVTTWHYRYNLGSCPPSSFHFEKRNLISSEKSYVIGMVDRWNNREKSVVGASQSAQSRQLRNLDQPKEEAGGVVPLNFRTHIATENYEYES